MAFVSRISFSLPRRNPLKNAVISVGHKNLRFFCDESSKKEQIKNSNNFEPPYPKFTKEERYYLNRGICETPIDFESRDNVPKQEIDPSSAPYNEVYTDGPDNDNFTKVEVLTDKHPELWYWVERLMKKNVAPHLTNTDRKYTTGYVPPRQEPPDFPYFVPRSRTKVLPVYKTVEKVEKTRTNLETKDSIVTTVIQHIEGDVRALERDLRHYLMEKHGLQRILSAVQEEKGLIRFKNDYTADVVMWLQIQGF